MRLLVARILDRRNPNRHSQGAVKRVRTRRISAFGDSATIHVIAVVAAVVFEARSSAALAASVTLPGFTFDFGKVANRATRLFPFLTGSPSLDRVTAPARSRSRSCLPNPLAQAPSDEHRPPLVLGEAALQPVVDKAWSRRDRWRLFHTIAGLADAHSPNDEA